MSALLIFFFPLGPLGFPLLGLLANGSLSLVIAGTAAGRAMLGAWLSSVFLGAAGSGGGVSYMLGSEVRHIWGYMLGSGVRHR